MSQHLAKHLQSYRKSISMIIMSTKKDSMPASNHKLSKITRYSTKRYIFRNLYAPSAGGSNLLKKKEKKRAGKMKVQRRLFLFHIMFVFSK